MADPLAQRRELERFPAEVRPYVVIARAFADDRISAVELESVYLQWFKRDESTGYPWCLRC